MRCGESATARGCDAGRKMQRYPAVAGVGSGANEMRHAGLTIPEDSVLALQSAVQEAMGDGRLQLPRHL